MKIKIFTLLLILFFISVLIPSAYAVEENTTEILTNSENDVLQSKKYYFNSSSSDGDGSKNNPYKDLDYSRFKDDSDLYFANGEYNINFDKYYARNINIYGQNASSTIIDGNGHSISNNYGGNLYFENVTLKNFKFNNYLNFEAKNSIFTSNISNLNVLSDGIINSYGGNVKLTNCIFKNNTASIGGAVYVEKSYLEVINCDFINNTALNYGGAISAYSASSYITNSRFNNCRASANSGAGIYLFDSTLTLHNSNFTKLKSKLGSAITAIMSSVSGNNLRFENNYADYEGGAIYMMYDTINLTNSYFFNNTARNGGALFLDSLTQASISSNNFINNNARECGGAIHFSFNIFNVLNNAYQNNNAKDGNDKYEKTTIDLIIKSENHSFYPNNNAYIDNIPVRYSLVEDGFVTSVKHQHYGGNCWAFSAIAALESSILKVGGNAFDFSENNMKNIIARFSDYGRTNYVNDGGNFDMALAYLSSWLGPILDSDDPYEPLSAISSLLNNTVQIQNALYLLREDYLDNDEVKKAILNYGAVTTSLYFDDYFLIDDVYYYCYDYEKSDHAVTVVGWDDTINIRGNLGAWIVKNSWGPEWGDNGYFYVSYYDETLLEVGKIDGLAFILNDTIPYNKNYQHETIGKTTTATVNNGFKYKNVFYATDDEFLAAVSTNFYQPYGYNIEIKVNNQLKHNQTGYVSQSGYFTLNLDKKIKLNKGDKFEVIIGLTSDDGTFKFAVARSTHSIRDAIFQPGISYRISSLGYEHDLYVDGVIACIKAFTYLDEIKTNNNLTIKVNGNNVNITSKIIDEYGNLVKEGNVTFIINGVSSTVNVVNGIASTMTTFNSELNSVSTIFNAIGYVSSNNSTSITRTTINANDLVTVYGNNDQYRISLTDIFSGNVANRKVKFTLSNGQTYETTTNTNGYATFNINLDAGNYLLTVSYAGYGSNNYNYTVVKNIVVNKKDLNIVIISYVDKNNATVLINDGNINDNVIVTVDGVSEDKVIANGQLTLNLNNLNYGSHTITVTSKNNYNFLNNTHTFNVTIKRTKINANDVVVYMGDNLYTVQLIDVDGVGVSGREIIFSDGVNTYKNITNANGFTSILLNLTHGTYDLEIKFDDTGDYIGSTKNVKIVIKSSVVIENEINDNQFKITLLDDDGNPISNQKVNITIDGVNYEVTSDANGIVSVALNHLSNDKYIVSVTNPVTGEIITQVIEISKKEEKHTEFNWISQNKDIIMYYGVSKYYTVRVCDNNGKYVSGIKVIFVFKGINYVAYSNPNGYASIKLSLKPGKYTIYVKYHDKTVSNKITVKQTLTAKNIKVKKGKTIKFQAKLVNTNGKALKNKKILFKFKGKNYKAKTNKKGIANLKIKLKLKVGKYTIKTSYGKNSIKNTIQIQK